MRSLVKKHMKLSPPLPNKPASPPSRRMLPKSNPESSTTHPRAKTSPPIRPRRPSFGRLREWLRNHDWTQVEKNIVIMQGEFDAVRSN